VYSSATQQRHSTSNPRSHTVRSTQQSDCRRARLTCYYVLKLLSGDDVSNTKKFFSIAMTVKESIYCTGSCKLSSAVAAAATCYRNNCMPKNAIVAGTVAGRFPVLMNNFYNRWIFLFLREIRNSKAC